MLSGLDGDTLAAWVSEIVEPGAIVHTDGWSGYGKLTRFGFDHRPHLQHLRGPDRQFVLPRADRAISNLKTWLQGTHRSASAKHLQVYLDEFVFRHNRRRTPMAAFSDAARAGGRCTSPRATARSPLAPQSEPTGYSRAALLG